MMHPYVFEVGAMVQRSPLRRWDRLTPAELSARGVLLKMTYLAYESKDCRWRVLWTAEGRSWEEVVRADYLSSCNETTNQV
jgi:hypothetical protein